MGGDEDCFREVILGSGSANSFGASGESPQATAPPRTPASFPLKLRGPSAPPSASSWPDVLVPFPSPGSYRHDDLLGLVVVVAVWIGLQARVLPKLGVPT